MQHGQCESQKGGHGTGVPETGSSVGSGGCNKPVRISPTVQPGTWFSRELSARRGKCTRNGVSGSPRVPFRSLPPRSLCPSAVFALGDARSFSGLTSKISPLG